MFFRVYKHFMRFQHNVEDAAWLKDKACLTPHKHGFKPNPVCNLEFIVATKEIIDFKEIKRLAISCIEKVANNIIEKAVETDDDGFLEYPFYDFGTLTTEELVDDLHKLMIISLKECGYTPLKIQIWLDETRKYAVWFDGEYEKNQKLY